MKSCLSQWENSKLSRLPHLAHYILICWNVLFLGDWRTEKVWQIFERVSVEDYETGRSANRLLERPQVPSGTSA